MSELDSVNFGAGSFDGIKCSAGYADPDAAELQGDETCHNSLSTCESGLPSEEAEVCSDGVCPTNWKPERPQAA